MSDHSGCRLVSTFAISDSDRDALKLVALVHHPLLKFSRSVAER
jgi:hypothetical protein